MSFQKKIIVCMLSSLILGVAYYFYTESVLKTSTIKVIAEVEVYSKDNLKEKGLDLYINQTTEFKKIEKSKVGISKNEFTYEFDINTKNSDFKLIRLDFENFNVLDTIKINKIEISECFGKPIITLKKDEIIKNLYAYSGSIRVNDSNIYFTDLNPVFDPYILLNVKSLLFFNIYLELILLLPWLIFFAKPIYKWLHENFIKGHFETILVCLFLIVLPLKIAWITFITLLMLITSIIRFFFFSKRVFSISGQHIIFFFIFSLYVVFGNVKVPNELSIQFGFILVPLIFVFNKNFINLSIFYEIYVKIFIVLMAIIVLNGLIFILLLYQYYDITPLSYFLPDNIKLLNQKMMWWLPYSHPTFLSSFFLVGFIFCQRLFAKKVINKDLFYLYFILAFISIVCLGSRMMLFMLIVFVLSYLFFNNNKKQGLIFVSIISVFFAIGLMVFIEYIDLNRFKLWNISYSAISENFFGYGIGRSKEVLCNPVFLTKNGYNLPPSENHSHNQFITILLELGIFALVLAVFAISYLGYILYKNSDKLFMAIYFLFFVILFTESIFKTATPIYYYTYIFCLSSLPNKNEINLS